MGRERIIQVRRDTAANWAARNPVLLKGEPGFSVDTGVFRLGDGVTPWNGLPSAGTSGVDQNWQSAGASRINWQVITQTTPGTPAPTGNLATSPSPPHTFSTVNGRGRFTARVPDGSLRTAYLFDGTDWRDSEIRSVWYPPSSMDPAKATPQMGHVHRAGSTGAVMVDQNVFGGYSSTWGAVWNWANPPSASTPTIDPAVTLGWKDALTRVTGFQIVNATTIGIYLANEPGFEIGDAVTFAQVNAAVDGARTLTAKFGQAWLITVVGATPGPFTPVAGTIDYTAPAVSAINPKEGYPMNVASRVTTPAGGNPVTDSILELKTWPSWTFEPVYGDPARSITVPLVSGSTTIPSTGKCGIVVNHLHTANVAGQYVEFGDVNMRAL